MTNFTPGSVNLLDGPSLSLGYHGGCVNELQSELNQTENAGLTADGTFGQATRQALVNFQRQYGLQADGMSGQKTAMTLANLIALGVPSMPAPQNYPPAFNPAVAASWAAANAATAGGFFDKNDPCTEFTSRALNAGGLPPDPTWYPPTDGVDRYINSGNLSLAWDNANAFTNYAVGNGWTRMIPLNLSNPASALMARPGDLIYLVWGNRGTHMTIATGFAGNQLLVSEKTGATVAYGADVPWNLSHSHGDVPISQQYPGARAYLLHWNESVV
jgi:peptidoglycan hydrolase-like protein with peptidoglycan-binding domain